MNSISFQVDGENLGQEKINQQLLRSITVADALKIASTCEDLQDQLKLQPRRIVDCRLEWEEFFGFQAHLTVEQTDDEPLDFATYKERKSLRIKARKEAAAL